MASADSTFYRFPGLIRQTGEETDHPLRTSNLGHTIKMVTMDVCLSPNLQMEGNDSSVSGLPVPQGPQQALNAEMVLTLPHLYGGGLLRDQP